MLGKTIQKKKCDKGLIKAGLGMSSEKLLPMFPMDQFCAGRFETVDSTKCQRRMLLDVTVLWVPGLKMQNLEFLSLLGACQFK